jgi:hypothetical protein
MSRRADARVPNGLPPAGLAALQITLGDTDLKSVSTKRRGE